MRSKVKKRHVLIGVTALSLAGAGGFSVFHAQLGDDTYEFTTANSVSIERTPAQESPQVYLNDAGNSLFGKDGKHDRADYTSRTAVSDATGTPQAASSQEGAGRENIPIIAASFTPVEMIRGGPTRFANALQGQNVNRGGKTDRLDAAQPIAKSIVARAGRAEPKGRGTSAAMFLLSSPDGYVEEPIGGGGDNKQIVAKANTNKATWENMIELARVTGGDGENIKEGIFGNLTENEFRAREFRCMATAIYHESRGEAFEGQVAVGQVIMTRVRSDFYPNTICGVVYQGQWNRRNACQFSFACDGRSDAPKKGKIWDTTIDVAKQVISGKAFIKEIAEATHYHATYVSPKWRLQMHELKRIGVHIFYKADFVRPLVANTDLDGL